MPEQLEIGKFKEGIPEDKKMKLLLRQSLLNKINPSFMKGLFLNG
jgi:hypothetical protein